MRLLCQILILVFLVAPVLAQTSETFVLTTEGRSLNYWQEFDITFWQTLPFATFWGYFLERQLSNFLLPGSAAHWQAIIPFAVVISAGNAMIHARRVIKK